MIPFQLLSFCNVYVQDFYCNWGNPLFILFSLCTLALPLVSRHGCSVCISATLTLSNRPSICPLQYNNSLRFCESCSLCFPLKCQQDTVSCSRTDSICYHSNCLPDCKMYHCAAILFLARATSGSCLMDVDWDHAQANYSTKGKYLTTVFNVLYQTFSSLT